MQFENHVRKSAPEPGPAPLCDRIVAAMAGEQSRLSCWIGILPLFMKDNSMLSRPTCPLTSSTGQGIEGCIDCAASSEVSQAARAAVIVIINVSA